MIRFDQMPPEVMQAMCTPMHEVLPSSPSTGGSIWLGSLSASMDAQLLREHRIGHLVQALDVPWLPDPATQGLQLEVYRMDLLDTSSADLRVHLEGVVKDIKGAVGRGKNVLIHCQQGVSRSAAILIAYLIKEHHMSYDQAFGLVRSRRACIKPNSGFVTALREWEGYCRAVEAQRAKMAAQGGQQRPDMGRRHTAW